MLRRRVNYLNFSMRLGTLVLPLVAFAVAGYIRFASGLISLRPGEIDPRDYIALLCFTTLIWALVVEHYDLAQFDLAFAAGISGWKVLRACAVTYIVVTGATFFYRAASYSRIFVALSAVLLFLFVLLSRQAFRMLLERARRKGFTHARILIIGADQFACDAAGSVLERLGLSGSLAGFVRLPGQQVTASGVPVVDLDVGAIRRECGEIDDIIIAVPPARFVQLPAIRAVLDPLSVPIRALLDLGKGVVVREALFDFEGIPLLDLRVTPSESVMYMLAKRGFDVIFSAVALLVTAPVMLLVALAIRLTSAGPVLFAQERVGLNGRVFRMYKFRTMRVTDAAESDTRWTKPEDERRTGLGTLLRGLSLDELPQFFNVLLGDMSIVGPRPERPFFVSKFMQEVAQYNTRHYLKVGITGWAQVNGWRGDTSIARRVEHDLYYLRHWSLMFDLKIIFLTLWRSVVANKNAY